MKQNKNPFIHAVGAKVLCFEPDPLKAKIIYQAKILEHKEIRVENKTKKSIYQVHFQGWKDRWDREVNEDMLLSDSPFNRRLKKEIEKVARRVKNKDVRRERIDDILDAAALVEDEKHFDWQECPGVWTEVEEMKRKSKEATEPNAQAFSSTTGSNDQVTIGHSDCQDDQSNEAVGRPEDDEVHLNFTPRLDMSDVLKSILEDDHHWVNVRKDYSGLQLPATPCVVDLLQTYVNGFPYTDIDLPQSDQESKVNDDGGDLEEEYIEADRSPVLCAETCSGLRILFDFLLRDHLLYEKEYDTHDRYFASIREKNSKPLSKPGGRRPVRSRHQSNCKTENELQPFKSEVQTSNHSRNRIELFPMEERLKDAELPCLSYGPIHFLRLFVKLPEIISKMSLTMCRRAIVLRHLVLLLEYLEQKQSQFFPEHNSSDMENLLIKASPLTHQPTLKFNKHKTSASKSVKSRQMKTAVKRVNKNDRPVKKTLRKLRHR